MLNSTTLLYNTRKIPSYNDEEHFIPSKIKKSDRFLCLDYVKKRN